MQSLSDLLDANIETVRKGVLPRIYQLNKDLAVQRVCKSTQSYRITKTPNGSDFRAPIEFAPPGTYGAANLDGGALGLGAGFAVSQFIQTFFETKMAFQLTWRSIMGTQTSDQSVLNAWTRTMEEGLPNMARYEDASWHNLGGQDGQVAVATSYSSASSSTGTYTLDTDIGARLMIPNQRFEILSSGGTWITQNYSPDSLPYVNPGGVNYPARQISITYVAGMTSPAAGDVLYFQGATPAGTPTWLQGLRYANTTTTSGNYLGLSRTTYPSINSSTITSGGTLTPAMVLAFAQLVRMRQGNGNSADPTKLIGLVSPHQIAVMNQTVQAMQAYYRTEVTQKQIDPLPSVQLDGGIIWGGVTHYEDQLQSATRIDYCNPDDWGRVYLNDKVAADFYRNPGNNEMFFPLYSAGSSGNGAPMAAVLFYLVSTLNYYNINPASSGLINNLTAPSSDYTY